MKRTVSILLLITMLLLVALPVGAASADGFTDSAEITHVEAVRMLTDLGLISGYSDGSFRPEVPVTRAQIAKLIALLSTEDPAAAQAAGFADVAESSWALSYIDYCAAQGIVSGSGGLFRPDDPVTALELCKMLLVVLGNDAARYTGAGWAENVRTDADSSHLLRDFSGSVSAAVTRENACLLILNALQNPAIHGFDEDGNALYVLDELRNPRTYLEIRFDAVRYSGIVAANDAGNLTDGAAPDAGTTRLAGYNRDFAIATDRALLGRMVNIYVRNGQVLGVPCEALEETSDVFTRADNLRQLLQVSDYTLSDTAAYYYNSARADSSLLQTLTGSYTVTVLDYTGDFVIDAVLIYSE